MRNQRESQITAPLATPLALILATCFVPVLMAQNPPEIDPATGNRRSVASPDKEQSRIDGSRMRLFPPVPNAVTPAADISAGTFGVNTGGGVYTFNGFTGFGTTTPVGLLHIASSKNAQNSAAAARAEGA